MPHLTPSARNNNRFPDGCCPYPCSQLRDIVPMTSPPKDCADLAAEAAKRAKHIVLADTLVLLRSLQARAAEDAAQLAELRAIVAGGAAAAAALPAPAAITGHSPDASGNASGASAASGASVQSLLLRGGSAECIGVEAAAAAGANGVSSSADGPMSAELPAPLPGMPASVGVLVEEMEGGCFILRINCRDRRGLLSDITSALRSLPLQVGIFRGHTRPEARGLCSPVASPSCSGSY